MVFANSVAGKSNTRAVLSAMPQCTVCTESSHHGLINFCVGKRFRLAVVPPTTGKHCQIAGDDLFDINAEPIFSSDLPGMVGYHGHGHQSLLELRDRLAI